MSGAGERPSTSGQIHVEDVSAGDELPQVVRRVGRAQLFLYSAATWNPHRIHYDTDFAHSEGHADVIVHGPLQGAWLTQYLTDWMGPEGRLVSAGWQNRASALPDEDLTFRGRVTSVDGDLVSIEVTESNAAGDVLMPAHGVVRLPHRAG
jgi:hydroxyacyl-ACP dehydratase HTD2-like protein with hotdog domain